MSRPSESIEVEVVEIDGVVPAVKSEWADGFPASPSRRDWQGRIRQLDARWWPLWLVLGTLVIGLMLTLGTLLALIYLVFRIIRGILRVLFR